MAKPSVVWFGMHSPDFIVDFLAYWMWTGQIRYFAKAYRH